MLCRVNSDEHPIRKEIANGDYRPMVVVITPKHKLAFEILVQKVVDGKITGLETKMVKPEQAQKALAQHLLAVAAFHLRSYIEVLIPTCPGVFMLCVCNFLLSQ